MDNDPQNGSQSAYSPFWGSLPVYSLLDVFPLLLDCHSVENVSTENDGPRALSTETKVESGTVLRKSGTSFNSSDSRVRWACL